ncbi:MAG: hypothetical protein ACKOOD_03085 [Microbacteriaceae bacterium]
MPAPRNNPHQRRQPLDPAIYRRRRIILLVIVGLLLWGLISGVMAVVGMVSSWFGGGNPQPSASQTVAAGQPCAVGEVRVDAVVGNADGTEAESFATGKNPNLWFKLTNVGSVSCTFDAGPAVQFFTIKSGNDQIWDSHNCDRAGLQSSVITLEPGVPQQSAPSPWFRVRSSDTGCGADQTPVDAGAYNLVATVNGVISEGNQFLIN